MKKIIIYFPFPLGEMKSGSSKRPHSMIRAFELAGVEPFVISGYRSERRKKIIELQNRIQRGEIFEFLYYENSSLPTLLSEKNHIPYWPWDEYAFFKFLKKNNIKIGVFWRDVYWKFPFYWKKIGIFKSIIGVFFEYLDEFFLLKKSDILFVPHFKIKDFLVTKKDQKILELPPGHWPKKNIQKDVRESLRFFYVGGMSLPNYDLRPTLEILKDEELILCVRKDEWECCKHYYTLGVKHRIVHATGNDVDQYFQESDVFVCVRNTHPYHLFSMPVKIFEAIGAGLPICVESGTPVAEFIKENQIGWVVDLKSKKKPDFCNNIIKIKQNLVEIQKNTDWTSRAQLVIHSIKETN